MKLLRHFEYPVGLADAPSLRKCHGFWSILRISGRGARIYPRDQSIDLLLRQPVVIRKRAWRGVGEPRGHFPCQDGLSNGLRPGPHVPIIRHRKRRGLTCTMTDLTSLLQDRLHVSVEGDRTRQAGLHHRNTQCHAGN